MLVISSGVSAGLGATAIGVTGALMAGPRSSCPTATELVGKLKLFSMSQAANAPPMSALKTQHRNIFFMGLVQQSIVDDEFFRPPGLEWPAGDPQWRPTELAQRRPTTATSLNTI